MRRASCFSFLWPDQNMDCCYWTLGLAIGLSLPCSTRAHLISRNIYWLSSLKIVATGPVYKFRGTLLLWLAKGTYQLKEVTHFTFCILKTHADLLPVHQENLQLHISQTCTNIYSYTHLRSWTTKKLHEGETLPSIKRPAWFEWYLSKSYISQTQSLSERLRSQSQSPLMRCDPSCLPSKRPCALPSSLNRVSLDTRHSPVNQPTSVSRGVSL